MTQMSYKNIFEFIPKYFQVSHAPLGQYVNIYIQSLPAGSYRNHDGTLYVDRKGTREVLRMVVLAEAVMDFGKRLAGADIDGPYPNSFYEEVVSLLAPYAELMSTTIIDRHWPR